MRRFLSVLMATATGGCLVAQEQDISLTVYSSADPAGFNPQTYVSQQRQGRDPAYASQVPGFGVVRETRALTFDEGVNQIDFVDVARFLDPTTVSFEDLSNPAATTVLEQQFLFDLVNPDKMLSHYLDREITVRAPLDGTFMEFTGTLLSHVGGQVVLQTANGLEIIPSGSAHFSLGAVPGGLLSRPTLRWLVSSTEASERTVRTSYQTDGMTWRSDYNLVLNQNSTQADLTAWVSLLNLSGKSYPDAKLKLIAGDVQRVQSRPAGIATTMRMKTMAEAAPVGFEEKSFFEYHLYTLPRRTTVASNTTQQILLFPTAREIPVRKVLVFDGLPAASRWGYGSRPHLDRNFGRESDPKVDVFVKFENREDQQLGKPLPAGKVRVYQQDPADTSLEFLGEDLIDHTPRNEPISIRLGQSFDVVGERTQTDFQVDQRAQRMRETYRIEIRNRKTEATDVVVRESLYRWVNWKLLSESQPSRKVNSRTIEYDLTLGPDETKVVEYQVEYTW